MRFLLLAVIVLAMLPPPLAVGAPAPRAPAAGNWPQLGHDAQRTNAAPEQVDPPYCYAWKWYEAPIASRAQPVVAGGRLFIGSMDGVMYARDATSGAPLWAVSADGSPIRHSAGVISGSVVFSTHAGWTYALDALSGAERWRMSTGASATAPLVDDARGRVVVASTDGWLTALDAATGAILWRFDAGAPILTTPALSADGDAVLFGNEAVEAIAVDAGSGAPRWRTQLAGQSLAERYPVAAPDAIFYRSQPIYRFGKLLMEGDAVMNQAGPAQPGWVADWAAVRPRIVSYLEANPAKQSFFALDATTGATLTVAPVLYTYGNNDNPAPPVLRDGASYLAYRARHGIQTDGGSVHVSSQYDAELGRMRLDTFDVAGLTSTNRLSGVAQFRLTSDEPAVLSMGGNILYVDNWERLGGISLTGALTGELAYVGHVSNDWPECLRAVRAPGRAECGPGGPNPFFPLSGDPADPAYPFPSPRVTDGYARGGVVVANGMLYWSVIEGGLAGIAHRAGSACPAPLVYTRTAVLRRPAVAAPASAPAPAIHADRPLTDYVTLDLTSPAPNPPADLVSRVRAEVLALVAVDDHPLPFYLERGMTTHGAWPHDTNAPGDVAAIAAGDTGNAYWHDPGELLYTLALAYPYLDAALQVSATRWLSREMALYPPLEDLPWGDPNRDWLRDGAPRERYPVPAELRQALNNWPPARASITALYGLWLWSKHTGDWSYAQAHWNDARALFNSRDGGDTGYYADIAGAIGYARLAAGLGDAQATTQGVQSAVAAMGAGRAITGAIDYARARYLDPRDQPTGWYLPVFYGLTPEVGLYLREQTGGLALQHVLSREQGDGLRWWYLTRAGAHAEVGETSFAAPPAAWSHFLARAYILGDNRAALRQWLDRPWGRGDLYSIQKLVAAIQAPQVDLPPRAYIPLLSR